MVSDAQLPTRGRPRDTAIDDGILAAALEELSSKGLAGLSLAAVAEAAGTTRPALYRRWSSKEALAVDAVARLAESELPVVTGEPFVDLVAELADFRLCIEKAGALPLAGAMLGEGVDPAVREAYVDRLVVPRRARIQGLLRDGIERGLLVKTADVELAGSMLTGSWYAYHVAGNRPPADWPERAARAAWQACGGRR